jgi:hypothetical protein
MRRLLTALIAVAGLAGAATSASAATVVFKGRAVVVGVSTACAASASTVAPAASSILELHDYCEIQFRPRGLGSNGPATHLMSETAEDDRHKPTLFTLDNGSLNGTFQAVDALQIALGDQTPTLTYQARIRLLQQTPSTLTNATKFVMFTAQIRNFGGISGCTATLRTALVR